MSLTSIAHCRIVTLQASSSQLLLVRAIVHPLIWSIMTQLLLHTARHLGMTAAHCTLDMPFCLRLHANVQFGDHEIVSAGPLPDLMIVVFACFIDIYKSVFGRFLLLQLSGEALTNSQPIQRPCPDCRAVLP